MVSSCLSKVWSANISVDQNDSMVNISTVAVKLFNEHIQQFFNFCIEMKLIARSTLELFSFSRYALEIVDYIDVMVGNAYDDLTTM